MKTSELTGAALDWAVAKCEFSGCEEWDETLEGVDAASDLQGAAYKPSTNWSQGGPIIEREGISVRPPRDIHMPNGSRVTSKADGWFATNYTEYPDGDSLPSITRAGPTALIAAMRCYVASKMGNEIDVPEEMR